jgi:hypothetical protein
MSVPDFHSKENSKNMSAVRVSILNKNSKQENLPVYDESQVYSALNSQNIKACDSRSGFSNHGYYRHLTGSDYVLEERPTRNVPSTIKPEQELYIDGSNKSQFIQNLTNQRADFINQIETSLQPLPIKPKLKGNKLRKKSKLKEAKLLREKEAPLHQPVSKSKNYKLNVGSSTSTPLNFGEKGKMKSSDAGSSAGKSLTKKSANSFVFMKKAESHHNKKVAPLSKSNSEQTEDPKTEGGKFTGMFYKH